jgi:hypothetical protein
MGDRAADGAKARWRPRKLPWHLIAALDADACLALTARWVTASLRAVAIRCVVRTCMLDRGCMHNSHSVGNGKF